MLFKSKARKLFLLLAGLLFSSLVFSQDYARPNTQQNQSFYIAPEHKKRMYIALSVGPAIPTLQFASTNVKGSFWDFHSPDSIHLQGFAQTGFHFNVTGSYLINDNWGVILQMGESFFNFDTGTFSRAIGGYPSSSPAASYSIAEFLIGPYYSFTAGDKWRFQFSAMIGLITTSYPEMNIQLNDTTLYTRDINDGSGFCWNLAGAVNYSLSNSIDLQLSLSYSQSLIIFPGWEETDNIVGYYPLTLSHNTCNLQMNTGIWKPTIGIVFKL